MEAGALLGAAQGIYDTWKGISENLDKKTGNSSFFAKQMAANDIALRYNKQLAAYQNDLALSNWVLQNQYNSPREQMNRYLEAGLNPNLIYGAGASSGNATDPGGAKIGGFESPSGIANAATSWFNSRVNAASTALSILGGAANVFEKLMTIKSTINATNRANEARGAEGMFNREYWNFLQRGDFPGWMDKGLASVASWNADATEGWLRNAIADYKLRSGDNKAYFQADLDNRLEKQQADLMYQSLLNGYQSVITEVAKSPIFGKSAEARRNMQLLDKRISLLGMDYLLRKEQRDTTAFQRKLGQSTINLNEKLGRWHDTHSNLYPYEVAGKVFGDAVGSYMNFKRSFTPKKFK